MERRLRRPGGQRRQAGALALLLCGLLVWFLGAPAQALEAPIRWTLQDGSGSRWGLVLLNQADPSCPPGWRLRLNALGARPPLDHRRPLRLDDGQGGAWELANRSEELVAGDAMPLPAASAQFDAAGLRPAPSGFLPLRLQVPLADWEGSDPVLTLGPAPVMALRELAGPATSETGPGAAPAEGAWQPGG